MTANELRIIIAIIGVIAFSLIWLFGKPKRPKQGRRNPVMRENESGERIEPTFGDSSLDESMSAEQGELNIDFATDELEKLGVTWTHAPVLRGTLESSLDAIAAFGQDVCGRR